MEDESISGSDPDVESEDVEEEEEEMEDNDGDDEDDLEENDDSEPTPVSSEHSPQPDARGWKCSTSTTSSQNERKQACSENGKKQRSTKPVHMRRNIRKLLREDQLEAGTKAAQQEELERLKRLEQQRKEFVLPTLPFELLQESNTQSLKKEPVWNEEETAQKTDEVLSAPPRLPKPEVICVDISSGSEEGAEAEERIIKDEDVIELSSGEEDSLHILDSESSNEEEEVNEESSGAHVNDALNQPDDLGRVLVNINHPPNEQDIFLAPQLARAVKSHQVGGIRFLYDNLVESQERFKSSSGFGCILAHSMGLGKTLQIVSFVDVLFRYTEARTVLAIVPVNTLQNWLAEFNMWLPAPEALPADYNSEEIQPRSFKVHILNDEHKTTVARAKVINEWSTDGGMLLMGYEMYRLLSLKKSFVTGRRKKTKKPAGPVIIDLDEEDRQQELLKGIEKALAKPGPDVVICDEGHRIKNCHASTSQALKSIRSRRRVVLTGYPLQNNLMEYWCMVDFVRPDFLGTRQEFSNMFERPILNGQCIDSTPQDVRLMRYRSHVLHSLLEGFVQRRGHDVLRGHLPDKEEHVLLVRLSKIQRSLYTEFMNRFRDAGNSGWLGLNPLKAFCVCCKIWNHPDVLYEALQKENLANEPDLDLEVNDLNAGTPNARALPIGGKRKTESAASTVDSANSKFSQSVGFNHFQDKANQVITYEWAKDVLASYQPGLLENSAKMVLLFELIEESLKLGDKILVFSQSLSTLSVIEEFLGKRSMPTKTGSEEPSQPWIRNVNYYRLDGSTSAMDRERLINQFNDPRNTKANLFLLSTRAGCLGINLVGANRVVVFDASWNPCHDAQAVCRVYRYGQKKPCYIYRLVSDYTLEKKIYDRQISKQGMSDRVIDDLNPVLNFTRKEVESLLHFVEEEPILSDTNLEPEKICDAVILRACAKHKQLVTKQPFQHESLLMDRKEYKLTKAEKKAAKKSYEDEKRASVPYTRPSYAQYYPASDQSLTNIPIFSQRHWRGPIKGLDEKPVASVRPLQSTPIPMMPRQVPGGMAMPGSGFGPVFPVGHLQRAGVVVQKIVTTTDIVIPGTNTSTDVQARINAGESIHVIRGTKGMYIRTCDGRIFAVRMGNKPKVTEGNHAAASGSQGDSLNHGSHSSSSPDQAQKGLSPEEIARPLSPDSPEIISELQRYAEAAAARESSDRPGTDTNTQGDHSKLRQAQPSEQLLGINSSASARAAALNVPTASRYVDWTSGAFGMDVRGGKRKTSSPSLEDHARKQRHSMPTQNYSLPAGFNLSSIGLSPEMSGLAGNCPTLLNPLYSAGSPYYTLPGLLGDPRLMYPMTTDPRLAASTAGPAVPTSATGAAAPFMLNPTSTLPTGLLPGLHHPFAQSLLNEPRMFAPYPVPLLTNSLPAGVGQASRVFVPSSSSSSGYPAPELLSTAAPQVDAPTGLDTAGSSDDDVIEVTSSNSG
ncbi:helicase ARIP4 [Carcharodon carcharias]|uniref:helicase ARIP4 n=1 Tax=Carcharodon carcharias TaxID=13397 RepID=UPI001B7EF2C5|nr:helicase ARIP4 [Carcharodon carcharias]XP_041047101.1 helicase ARIP4 [Carcharodon carcharias]